MEANPFVPIYANLVDDFKFIIDIPVQERPLLAHYTSVEVIRSLLVDRIAWLSNPLLMNDWQELVWGLNQAKNLLGTAPEIAHIFPSEEMALAFRRSFQDRFDEFDRDQALDTYIMCFSEHDKAELNGLLSMWRGYGHSGSGATIVFDTSSIVRNDESPLMLAKVEYLSDEKRTDKLKSLLVSFLSSAVDHLKSPDALNWSSYHLSSYYLFEITKLFALTHKHDGFSEEREWRIVYQPSFDPNKLLHPYFNYHISPRGIEPKLKVPIDPFPGDVTWKLKASVDRIILGPAASSPMSFESFLRMLRIHDLDDLASIVVPSGIPYRRML